MKNNSWQDTMCVFDGLPLGNDVPWPHRPNRGKLAICWGSVKIIVIVWGMLHSVSLSKYAFQVHHSYVDVFLCRYVQMCTLIACICSVCENTYIEHNICTWSASSWDIDDPCQRKFILQILYDVGRLRTHFLVASFFLCADAAEILCPVALI